MCAIARVGLDVRPFLDVIEQNPDAVFHYVNANAVSLLKGKLSNAFWETYDAGQDVIIEWLLSEKVNQIYAQAAARQA